MSDCYFCVHGHFYQPPRADPFTNHISREPDAAPYANWNERIAAESYTPLAEAGSFERISFNLGGTLARWLDEHAPATYERIVAGERAHYAAHGVSNGLAQPVHHTILPLARRRDKVCQVRWGIASFTHRFGHRPEGMWLPEMAVDEATLQVLVSEGIRFTILSDEQVRGSMENGAGPYWVRIRGEEEKIAVFVRDRHLSNTLSFDMPDPGNVDGWIWDHVRWRCQRDGLLLAATDGETFGHHRPQGAAVLQRILEIGEQHGYTITTLGRYLRDHPPKTEIEIVQNSSWSCPHGLARWVVGCECTEGDSRWKGALRRALDNLACNLDAAYEREALKMGLEPWALRDEYIAVVMGEIEGPELLARHGLSKLGAEGAQRMLWLLEAQFYRQRMYASCTFFFERLERYEPRYGIANGVRAIALTCYATGEDLTPGLYRDLRVAINGQSNRTGADILDEILKKAEL
ncbi:MAG: DUF3536 domain-containing protein [Anaerolineae bacterium]|nr:DUF3536 domain-containing protein [Anaerolineae bacterium]